MQEAKTGLVGEAEAPQTSDFKSLMKGAGENALFDRKGEFSTPPAPVAHFTPNESVSIRLNHRSSRHPAVVSLSGRDIAGRGYDHKICGHLSEEETASLWAMIDRAVAEESLFQKKQELAALEKRASELRAELSLCPAKP